MGPDKSIPELTRDIAFHLGDMFRNEIKLARIEATESAKEMTGSITQIGIGMAFLTTAITLGLMALAYGLSIYIPMWAALSIPAIAALLFAVIFINTGRAAMAPKKLTLPKTREQIGRDIQTLKEHLPS